MKDAAVRGVTENKLWTDERDLDMKGGTACRRTYLVVDSQIASRTTFLHFESTSNMRATIEIEVGGEGQPAASWTLLDMHETAKSEIDSRLLRKIRHRLSLLISFLSHYFSFSPSFLSPRPAQLSMFFSIFCPISSSQFRLRHVGQAQCYTCRPFLPSMTAQCRSAVHALIKNADYMQQEGQPHCLKCTTPLTTQRLSPTSLSLYVMHRILLRGSEPVNGI